MSSTLRSPTRAKPANSISENQCIDRGPRARTVTRPIRPSGVFLVDSGDERNWINRILIGTPSRGTVRIEWVAALRSVVTPANWGNGWSPTSVIDECYPVRFTVAHAQNVIVRYFMEAKPEYEWLLLIEDDVCVPPDLFIRLDKYLRDGPPIVSGLYYQKAFPPEPLIYRGRGNGAFLDWKPGAKVWCDGVPTGCLAGPPVDHRDPVQRVAGVHGRRPDDAGSVRVADGRDDRRTREPDDRDRHVRPRVLPSNCRRRCPQTGGMAKDRTPQMAVLSGHVDSVPARQPGWDDVPAVTIKGVRRPHDPEPLSGVPASSMRSIPTSGIFTSNGRDRCIVVPGGAWQRLLPPGTYTATSTSSYRTRATTLAPALGSPSAPSRLRPNSLTNYVGICSINQGIGNHEDGWPSGRTSAATSARPSATTTLPPRRMAVNIADGELACLGDEPGYVRDDLVFVLGCRR